MPTLSGLTFTGAASDRACPQSGRRPKADNLRRATRDKSLVSV